MAAKADNPGLATRLLALRLIERVEEEGAWPSRMVALEGDRAGLSAVDKALVMQLVQTVLRRRQGLDHIIADCANRGRVSAPVRRVLSLGLAQLLLLERIPDHAAVDLSVRAARRLGLHRQTGLINGILRRVIRERGVWLARLREAKKGRFAGPAPKWLWGRWAARYGLENAARLQARLGEAPVNDARVDVGDVQHWCEQLGAEAIAGEPPRMVLTGGSPARMAGFAEGAWSVQDRNAARIVPLLPEGGARVADLCAAPGSKTLQLARRYPKADLVAFELHPHRADLVRQGLARCGLEAEVVVGDARQQLSERGTFDRIVLDAPCSGLGTLRRHPEIALRQSVETVRDNAALQQSLLEAAIEHLATGGFVVYSVCSLEPEEGSEVIDAVLSDGRVRLVSSVLDGGSGLFGLDGDGDGFFVALLEKIS